MTAGWSSDKSCFSSLIMSLSASLKQYCRVWKWCKVFIFALLCFWSHLEPVCTGFSVIQSISFNENESIKKEWKALFEWHKLPIKWLDQIFPCISNCLAQSQGHLTQNIFSFSKTVSTQCLHIETDFTRCFWKAKNGPLAFTSYHPTDESRISRIAYTGKKSAVWNIQSSSVHGLQNEWIPWKSHFLGLMWRLYYFLHNIFFCLIERVVIKSPHWLFLFPLII